jgi:hypothetical protein
MALGLEMNIPHYTRLNIDQKSYPGAALLKLKTIGLPTGAFQTGFANRNAHLQQEAFVHWEGK